MRKELIVIGLLLLMPFISAVTVDLNSQYQKGETLIATISGTFETSLLKDNIKFYRDNHVRIPMDFEMTKILDNYYLYASLIGKNEGNYSLSIEGINYIISLGESSNEDIRTNFTITNDIAEFAISPGFIITQDDFSLEISNLRSETVQINIESEYSSSNKKTFLEAIFGSGTPEETKDSELIVSENPSYILIPGETKIINFHTLPINASSLFSTTISSSNISYNIPVYIIKEEIIEDVPIINPIKNFSFDPLELTISMPLNEKKERIIMIKNLGNIPIEDISIIMEDSLSKYLEIGKTEIAFLNVSEEAEIPLSFKSTEDIFIQGKIFAEDKSQEKVKILLTLNFSKGSVYNETYESLNKTIIKPIGAMSCSEINGTFCNSEATCNDTSEYVKDGNCCLGSCLEPEKSNNGKIIGWTIIVLVLALVSWFFKNKFSKGRKEVDVLKFAEGKKK